MASRILGTPGQTVQHGYEATGYRSLHDRLSPLFAVAVQGLILSFADGQDECAAFAELMEQKGRQSTGTGRDRGGSRGASERDAVSGFEVEGGQTQPVETCECGHDGARKACSLSDRLASV